MYVVSCCSLKGGVGKTSIVLGLADAARRAGIPTLVVDLDPQGDASHALGIEGTSMSSGAIIHKPSTANLERAIVSSPWAEGSQILHVLPGSTENRRFDDPNAWGAANRTLATALHKLDYPLVLIDAPPTMQGLTRSALVASNRMIGVTEPGVFSLKAAQRLLEAAHMVRSRESVPVQPLGLVVNRYRHSLREHQEKLAALKAQFGPLVLQPVLPERVVVQRAQARRLPLSLVRNSRPIANDFAALFARMWRARLLGPDVRGN